MFLLRYGLSWRPCFDRYYLFSNRFVKNICLSLNKSPSPGFRSCDSLLTFCRRGLTGFVYIDLLLRFVNANYFYNYSTFLNCIETENTNNYNLLDFAFAAFVFAFAFIFSLAFNSSLVLNNLLLSSSSGGSKKPEPSASPAPANQPANSDWDSQGDGRVNESDCEDEPHLTQKQKLRQLERRQAENLEGKEYAQDVAKDPIEVSE